MMLAVAGKFAGDYTDGRYSESPGDLTHNLGRMPYLEVSGEGVGQSTAINFYLATELGLMGSSTLEAARIISIQEHLKELNTAYRAIVPFRSEPTEEGLDKWFTAGATDFTGAAAFKGQGSRYLRWWMARIEACLGDAGYAVGSKLSLADVVIYSFFGDHLTAEQAGALPAYAREPFGNKARTDAALAKHPKLQACVQAVANNENIQKYLANRGVQGF